MSPLFDFDEIKMGKKKTHVGVTNLAGHILDALRRNNKTGVINSEFCIRMIQLARIRM